MLALMFAWTLAHTVDRANCYIHAKYQTKRFLTARRSFPTRAEWKRLLVVGESLKASHVATVYSHGLREFLNAGDRAPLEQLLEAVIRSTRIVRSDTREKLRRGLASAAAISKTAPLIGLFATCIGILDSFRGYDGNKHGYIAFIAKNLAEALVPTTAGLLVGVAATWTFNWQSERVAALDVEMEIASLELVSFLH